MLMAGPELIDDSDYLDGFDYDEFELLSVDEEEETTSTTDADAESDAGDGRVCIVCNVRKDLMQFQSASTRVPFARRGQLSTRCLECRSKHRRRDNAWRRRARENRPLRERIRRVTYPEFMAHLEVGLPQFIEYTLVKNAL